MTNERQKVQITVTKTDSETKKALEGAVFGLFAKEDIVNKDGKVIVKADTQIERAVTGKDGKATFTSDLPLGQYYVKEIEAPKGYVKSDKTFDVDVLLNSEYSAKYLQQLWKKVRKQGGLCTGIMQNIVDLLQNYTATTMLANRNLWHS